MSRAMHTTTAGEALGFCCCGSHIEPGEQIVTIDGRATHAGCVKRAAQRSATATPQMDLWQSESLLTDAQRWAIEQAEAITGASRIAFDGESVRAVDIPRLAKQCAKVFGLMRDGQYRTLTQIASACGCLETSAGARLRDLRKARFGGHTVESRRVAGTTLLYEYRVILNNGPATETNDQRQAA